MSCPYYNDSKTDPWNGIYCEKINARPGVKFWSSYCDHKYEQCPYMGGDDPYELVNKKTVAEPQREESKTEKEVDDSSSSYYYPDPVSTSAPASSVSSRGMGGGILLFDNFLFKIFAYLIIFTLCTISSTPTVAYQSFGLDTDGTLVDVLTFIHLCGAAMLAAYSVNELADGSILKGLIGPALAAALVYGLKSSARWFTPLQIVSSVTLTLLGLPCGFVIVVGCLIAKMILPHIMGPEKWADTQEMVYFVAVILAIISSVCTIKNKIFSSFYLPNWISGLRVQIRQKIRKNRVLKRR